MEMTMTPIEMTIKRLRVQMDLAQVENRGAIATATSLSDPKKRNQRLTAFEGWPDPNMTPGPSDQVEPRPHGR
jgi:hypothetical protein